MAFLIDLTDDKFKIPGNEAVIGFIRRANPFAHTDPAGKLAQLGKAVAGVRIYVPSPRSASYLALHADANVIFAPAFGMKTIALRLPPDVLAQGGAPFLDIGEDWLSVEAFRAPAASAAWDAMLQRWVEAAYRTAMERGRRPCPGQRRRVSRRPP
ncbi:MAG TPA: hypothetical protein VJO12_01705 [Stellaceae bacterium]|nr:hypothetical protein [Stellaceae bacterium]